MILIAEIGNNHFGDIVDFKEHILAAKEHGATLVKSQAFESKEMISGSMPVKFYRQCQFQPEQLIELIYWSRDVAKIELFFSIFSRRYECLLYHQVFFKIAANQSRFAWFSTALKDSSRCFVSIGENISLHKLSRASVLYASPYPPQKPRLDCISEMSAIYGRSVGYSDHTEGIDACISAIQNYGCNVIEKHFTIEKNKKWNSKVFRDTVFAATPKELELIARGG